MGEVSLWHTQTLNASMEEHEETSELRDTLLKLGFQFKERIIVPITGDYLFWA